METEPAFLAFFAESALCCVYVVWVIVVVVVRADAQVAVAIAPVPRRDGRANSLGLRLRNSSLRPLARSRRLPGARRLSRPPCEPGLPHPLRKRVEPPIALLQQFMSIRGMLIFSKEWRKLTLVNIKEKFFGSMCMNID